MNYNRKHLLAPADDDESPILPSSSNSPELIVSVNVAKNPIVRGEPQVFHITVFDPEFEQSYRKCSNIVE